MLDPQPLTVQARMLQEGLEICGHVEEATRDVCLQFNVANHNAIRHKWSGPNNGECCYVDDGDVGVRHPIGTALNGGHTACIALGGAASVVSHQTEEVEGGGGEARDCSLKFGMFRFLFHCFKKLTSTVNQLQWCANQGWFWCRNMALVSSLTNTHIV